jgi:hypothetical protein
LALALELAAQRLLLLLEPRHALARRFGRLGQLRRLRLEGPGAGAGLLQRRPARGRFALGAADLAAQRLQPL